MRGTFVNEVIGEPQDVFIFAGTLHSYKNKAQEIQRNHPGEKFFFHLAQTEKNLEDMQRRVTPVIALADDWYDSPMLLDYRFKLLVTTGHL